MRRYVMAALIAAIVSLTSRDFAQDNLGRLLVRVTDETGAAVPHAQLGFRPRIKSVPRDVETGTDGTLLITAPLGNYTIFAAHPTLLPAAQKVQLRSQNTEEVTVALANPHDSVVAHTGGGPPIDLNHVPIPSPPVAVAITVTDHVGIAVPHAQILIGSQSCGLPGTDCGLRKTNEQGKLKLRLTPGFYDVVVTRPFFLRWRKQDVRIEQGVTTIAVALAEIDNPAPSRETSQEPR